MTFPLATYTAEHGLAWFYDTAAIAFDELDKCRKLLGPLPDFDAGECGYEGVAAVGNKVFAIRCVSAPKWDFRGRDATHLTATWLARSVARRGDFDKLLQCLASMPQTHDYQFSFVADCEADDDAGREGFAGAGRLASDAGSDVFMRRNIGEKSISVKITKKGDDAMTEAERILRDKDRAGGVAEDTRSIAAKQEVAASGRISPGARVAAVAVFIVLILLGTYFAKVARPPQTLLGTIIGVAAYGLARVLWNIKK